MSDEKKIGIVLLMKYNKEHYASSPEKEAELSKAWGEHWKKWESKLKRVCNYHCVGLGKFDGFWVWEVTDIGDWEAMAEEWMRFWGKYIEYSEVHMGINEPAFNEATKEIPHFIELKKKLQ